MHQGACRKSSAIVSKYQKNKPIPLASEDENDRFTEMRLIDNAEVAA